MKNDFIDELKKISGEDYVLTDPALAGGYLYDETEIFVRPAAAEGCVVVKPGGAEEISKIIRLANAGSVPVYTRGGGTGLSGGLVPTETGVVLCMERFDRPIEVDDKNLMVTVGAGVTLGALTEALDGTELFFPIHPGEEGAHIGGMAATNAGGSRAVKHGVMRNQVKGLEVVLPTGEIVSLGGRTIKNNTGYDLMHLMIGSEGTLGVITKVTLKLYGKPGAMLTAVVSFHKKEDAARAVPILLQKGIVPLAVEYIERETAEHSAAHMGLKWPALSGTADLMFVLDGDSEDGLFEKCGEIIEVCEECGAADNAVAESAKDQRDILAIRSNVYTAYKNEIADTLDMAVPPARMPEFIDRLIAIAARYGTTTPICGHIADGNIHNFILREDGQKPPYYDEMTSAMYEAAINMSGTVTAEHGVGKTRRRHMRAQLSKRELEIMRAVKSAFDPNGIMNPGALFI